MTLYELYSITADDVVLAVYVGDEFYTWIVGDGVFLDFTPIAEEPMMWVIEKSNVDAWMRATVVERVESHMMIAGLTVLKVHTRRVYY